MYSKDIQKIFNLELKFEYNFEEEVLDSFKDVIAYKNKLNELKESIKQLEKDYKALKQNKTISDISAFTSNVEVINDINVLVAIREGYDVDMIKSLADTIINKYEECFVLLANVNNNHVNIISKSNTDKVNCGVVVKELSVKCKGNGGGSKTFAQGGGSDAKDITKYLEEIKESLK